MNVLVTAIGSMSAEAVIGALHSLHHRVIGSDIHPPHWLPTAKLVDSFYQTPHARSASQYLEVLDEVCRAERIDVILPLTDPEVDVLSARSDSEKGDYPKVAISPPNVISLCRDKWSVCKSLDKHPTLHAIPTRPIKGIKPNTLPLPAIAKPRRGRSSEGLFRLDSSLDAEYVVASEHFLDHVVQPFLPGDWYAVDIVRHPSTRHSVSIPRRELIRTANGAGLSVELVDDPNLSELASQAAEHFGAVGCINIEFILHRNEYYLVDVNPRFSAGLAFTQLAGYDMVSNHLKCFFDDDIDQYDRTRIKYLGKRYHDIVLSEIPSPC